MTEIDVKGHDTWRKFDPNKHVHIVDGPPRLSHKTTEIVQASAGYVEHHDAGVPVFVGNNYEQIDETVNNHYNGGKYGVEPDTVVAPMGKEQVTDECPDGCDHSVDGSTFGKIKHKSREVAAQNDVVKPETFRGEDVCAYQATKFAMAHADVIICVAQMLDRIWQSSYFPDNYQIIVDEESTLNYFKASGFKLAEITPAKGDIGPEFTVDFEVDEQNVNNVYQRNQSKIDDLERVASRYRNIENACEWLEELVSEATNYDFNENGNLDDYIDYLSGLEPGHVDLTGPQSEQTATFDRLRMDYHRFKAAKPLEAAFFKTEVQVVKSGDKYDVRVIPDPTTDFLILKNALNTAENVWFVGDYEARDVAESLNDGFEMTELSPSASDLDDLKIIMVDAPDDQEHVRREYMTKLSRKLANERVPHPVFAGSGLRAQQTAERIGPDSYFFNASATRRNYEEMAGIGYAITSYPGSRISRGVDLPTNVTIVRSTQFQSGVWDYQGNDDKSLKCERMRRYSKEIEVHNMMLRGAGQGEKHVAVVPSMVPYFGLEDVVEEVSINDDLNEVFDRIMAWLYGVKETIEGMYGCPDCQVAVLTMDKYIEHRRSQHDTNR